MDQMVAGEMGASAVGVIILSWVASAVAVPPFL